MITAAETAIVMRQTIFPQKEPASPPSIIGTATTAVTAAIWKIRYQLHVLLRLLQLSLVFLLFINYSAASSFVLAVILA